MLRKLSLSLALLPLLILSAGCIHSQIPTNPIVSSCPTANTGTWTALETGSTEIVGISSKDTPATGSWCYAVTSVINTSTPIGQSIPSNIVLVTTTTSLPVVDLNWVAPSGTPVPTGYIAYRIAAIQTTIGAPNSLGTTTSVSSLEKAPSPANRELAMQSPVKLQGAAIHSAKN